VAGLNLVIIVIESQPSRKGRENEKNTLLEQFQNIIENRRNTEAKIDAGNTNRRPRYNPMGL